MNSIFYAESGVLGGVSSRPTRFGYAITTVGWVGQASAEAWLGRDLLPSVLAGERAGLGRRVGEGLERTIRRRIVDPVDGARSMMKDAWAWSLR
jgi:hypothetical protein